MDFLNWKKWKWVCLKDARWEGMYWIHLAQNRNHWWIRVNKVANSLVVLQKTRNILRSYQPLKMVSAPSGRRVTRDLYLCYNDELLWVLVQQFFMVAPNIYGPSVWNLLHGTLLVPRILRWLLRLGKSVHCWSRGKVLTCYIKCFDKFCFSTLSVTYKHEFGNKWFVKGSFNHVLKVLCGGKKGIVF